MKIEVRQFNIDKVTRDGTDAEPTKIGGYASVFNSPTVIADTFQETIAPGAFSRSLGEGADVRSLFNHDWANVLGRVSAKTLTLNEDEHGLKFEVILPDTSIGRDLAVSMQRGDINQCSFGFVVKEDEWDYSNSDMPKRTITDVELYEVSVVALPAYDDTSASVMRDKNSETNEIIAKIKTRQEIINQIKRGLMK